MHKQIKNILSLFLLSLFLLPLAEKELHAYQHRDDTHCASTDKHFHEEEHYCSLCDFTITDSTPPSQQLFSNILIPSDFYSNPFGEKVYPLNAHCHLPSRAPPLA